MSHNAEDVCSHNASGKMLKSVLSSMVILWLGGCIERHEATVSNDCMRCICKLEGCDNNLGSCNLDVGTYSCGPYQIKEPYYIDCYSPGAGWEACAQFRNCSERCVQSYMSRYSSSCTTATTDCERHARQHNGGPNGCSNPNTLWYWNWVKECIGDLTCTDQAGECKDVSEGCLGGAFQSNLCSGGVNRKCCIYNDGACTNSSGTCFYSTKKDCVGGEFESGLCGGPAERKCCVRDDSKCEALGGVCRDTSLGCDYGVFTTGNCDGPASRKCCGPRPEN
ncbi:unnamed protein product [Owenia fusiformis]|uniref:lysozyme n=1 Tax=Owenia fusiformis TaxID=6347 RepID=A0A8S4PNQ9_OWEFU|nr:unnamed protein product [Owenia fusiformis]